jgi:hypothetical protein
MGVGEGKPQHLHQVSCWMCVFRSTSCKWDMVCFFILLLDLQKIEEKSLVIHLNSPMIQCRPWQFMFPRNLSFELYFDWFFLNYFVIHLSHSMFHKTWMHVISHSSAKCRHVSNSIHVLFAFCVRLLLISYFKEWNTKVTSLVGKEDKEKLTEFISESRQLSYWCIRNISKFW